MKPKSTEGGRSRVYNAPARDPVQGFFGRETDLERIESGLQSGAAPRVAIEGLAGVGKTELALQVVYRLAKTDRYPGGIFWLDAATPALDAVWGGGLADALEVPSGPVAERARQVIRRLEAGGKALVVLDNVESWTGDERPAPLPRGPSVHLLVTTQHQGLGGPNVFQHHDLRFLGETAARAMLLSLSGRDGAAEPGLDALLNHLGGHTLALELAGAYLATYPSTTAGAYLARLQAGADPEADVTPQVAYARTVEQSLDAIWERLDVAARRAWQIAGVFAPAEATVELLTACDVDEATQRALRRHHVISLSPTRWSMHRLVRAYGARAGTDEERTAAQRRFLDAVVTLAGSIDAATGYRVYRENLSQLDRALDLAGTTLASAPAVHGWLLDRVGTGAQSAGDLPRAKELLEGALASDLQHRGEEHPSVATSRSNLALVLQALGDLPRAKELLERALASDLQNLGEDHPSVAACRSNLAGVLQDLGDLPRAKELLERALASDLQNLGEDHPSVATRRSNLAGVLQDLGDLPRAKELLERALASDLQNLGEDHPSVATSRSNLATVHRALGDLPRAKDLLDRALASDLQHLGDDHPSVAIRRSNLALVLQDLGDLPRAKDLLERALAWALQNLGEDHPSVATRRSNLAGVLQDLGDLPRAKELLERALASALQNLGGDHPSVATSRSNLALVLQALGDLPRAKELLERALASDLQNLGEDHPSVATRRSNLAGVLQDLGDLPRAKELLERALASDLQNLGEDHPSVATRRSNLAGVLQYLGDLPRAKELLERALASDLQNLGEDHPSVATRRSNLAGVLQDLGDLPRAKELLERALASDLQNLGEDHPSVAARRTNLAGVLQDLGDLPRAKELLERALASDLQNLGEDHPRVAINRSNLALVLKALGDLPRAKELLVQAIEAARKLGDEHPNVITYRKNLAKVVKRMNAAAAVAAVRTESKEPTMTETHDVFICHASEDKERFVEPLVAALVGHGLRVWYDRFAIGLGDDVRAKMNEGLRGSRFGVVLVSPSSSKFWPQAELSALFNQEARGTGERPRILPVRCDLSVDELTARDPLLAGRRSIGWEEGLDAVARAIVGVVERARAGASAGAGGTAAATSTPPRPAMVAPVTPGSPPATAPRSGGAAGRLDLGLVIALPEELRQVLALVGDYTRHPSGDLDAYLFTRNGYRCAAVLVGEMGQTQAGVFTERFIAALDPAMIVSMGIAGGLNDLCAGDVHVPSQSVEYLQDAKAAGIAGGGFAIVPGAPAYRVDYALLRAARALEFDHPAAFRAWRADAARDLAALLPDADKRAALLAGGDVRAEVVALADGHVATGPVVGAARGFADWIRSHDRNVKSIEMEASAVVLAATTRPDPRRAFILRAISDLGDERKKDLDGKSNGVLRRWAMNNAVRYLWTLLDVGALPRATPAGTTDA